MGFRFSLILLVVALGCDSGALIEGPAPEYSEAGVQCALPDGPLGVCERRRCNVEETSPCFQCTSQH
jgi:hypothetical protein